jgi:hypothetical protein
MHDSREVLARLRAFRSKFEGLLRFPSIAKRRQSVLLVGRKPDLRLLDRHGHAGFRAVMRGVLVGAQARQKVDVGKAIRQAAGVGSGSRLVQMHDFQQAMGLASKSLL